jgi:hypothetical protein
MYRLPRSAPEDSLESGYTFAWDDASDETNVHDREGLLGLFSIHMLLDIAKEGGVVVVN